MLSCMETQLGLMVIGPNGKTLRIQRNNPAFLASREILRQSMPSEQVWQKLQELVVNPLKALVSWCEGYGLTFKDEGDTLKLNDVTLARTTWLPLLNRTQAVGGSPRYLLNFAEKLGPNAKTAMVGEVALHLREDKLKGLQPALLKQVNLPAECRMGDLVTESSTGKTPFLVSYEDYSATAEGVLQCHRGMVLSAVRDEQEAQDILAQPAVLGFNRTYRCEEGTPEGWLEDLSFDSLKAARLNAKEIQDSGSESRIINRITGQVVALH